MISKDIKERIKNHFFINPSDKLRVREIERKLKLSLPSVIRYCKELKKEGLLSTIEIGNVKFYTASKTNTFFLEKRLYNIKQIYLSGLIGYLKKELNNPTIVLFGSFAKGEDTEDSDIDLYIESPSRKQLDLSKFEKKLERDIQIFDHGNIREIKNVHLANNIINGITLNKYIEVFK
jgi:predicted nucleotidyltransferase